MDVVAVTAGLGWVGGVSLPWLGVGTAPSGTASSGILAASAASCGTACSGGTTSVASPVGFAPSPVEGGDLDWLVLEVEG